MQDLAFYWNFLFEHYLRNQLLVLDVTRNQLVRENRCHERSNAP